MTGSLFRRKEKRTDEDSDYNGSALINGKEYWVNGYLKYPQDQTKKPYLSLKFKEKKPKGDTAPPPAQPKHNEQPADGPAPADDDIPF